MNNSTRPPLDERFQGDLNPALTKLELGTGRIAQRQGALDLIVEPVQGRGYSNAQLYDYPARQRRDFPDRPPLRMVVQAHASHRAEELLGTAGFGFWNQPVMPGAADFRLPRAVWFFFGSPPNNMAFAKGVPGHGWKAATLNMSRPPFLLLAPFAPIGFLLMRIPSLYRTLWPLAQRAIGASESLLKVDLRESHRYQLDWLPQRCRFYVDDQLVLESPYSPQGPLGFVTWLDNQYAVVTPQGQIGMGLIPIPQRQSLTLEHIHIEPL